MFRLTARSGLPLLLAAGALLAAFCPDQAHAQAKVKKYAPGDKDLAKLVASYLEADEDGRAALRAECDEAYEPLKTGSTLSKLRKNALKAAAKFGPKVEDSGSHFLYDEKKEEGRYILQGKGKGLFVALHGGGEGRARAEGATRLQSIGDCYWFFPQCPEDSPTGWTSPDAERLVMDLIDAAKRCLDIDPNRVYITGTSMGGFGTWGLAARHPDVFAAAAAFAGSPPTDSAQGRPGVFANLCNVPISFYHSLDDPLVPAEYGQYAEREMKRWQEEHPGCFVFRHDEQDGQGHGRPKEGVGPAHEWAFEHERNARPKKVLWQPLCETQQQCYWLYWQNPALDTLVQAEVLKENEIHITVLEGQSDLAGLSVLLGDPLVDLGKEVAVFVGGEERFRGKVERTLSTILLTVPRFDEDLLFDARVDL
ncbi:MAG: prolyl oligopeptidase family serine peptidase [Planctomycetes bacterium]|nr:prolyl oligopeptidase family serine peptidase [Planctomycetota bacterium]